MSKPADDKGGSKKGTGGRPKSKRQPTRRNRRMPPVFEPKAPTPFTGHFGGGEHAKRYHDFLELKADPMGANPEIAGAFARVIAGFPDEVFSDEATLIIAGTRPKTIADAFSAQSLPSDPKKVEGLRKLAAQIEKRRQSLRDEVGAYMTCAVEHFTADQAEEFFKAIVQMKRNHEAPAHRNALAYAAYSDFAREFEREPSKPELKKYMIERRATYPDQPGPEDGRGWGRLWIAAGLSSLADR